METSEITSLVLGTTVVGLVFKDKLKLSAKSLWDRLTKNSVEAELMNLEELLAEHEGFTAVRHKNTQSELNHIKGQLQEVLQGQKSGQESRLIKISSDVEALFERLNMVAKQVSDVQGSTEYLEAAVKAESERPTAKLYSEGLASLANASSATLERLAAVEKLLADIVNVLTRRAD